MNGGQDSGPTHMNQMNHHILKSYHMYFHWYDVSNLCNENVTKVRLIVNMPFKSYNVEGHSYIDAKLIIICLESYGVWIPWQEKIDYIRNVKYLNILQILSHCEVVCGRR